ncbi:HAD family phosphatase [Vagococcus sp. BWB3-3]|uniref:HAD family phosphatase n=1 Tax=Vagococcus allomyrinae TaxID=2794353 RepID=A0A940P5F6_9ENTE|nr:Cof-type HAD-IIB family hydrolase [Vagococcus allomyrinae]MBP1041914.1 HAD family phosphatase [Vagococcus allomyrinae]
MTIKAIILDLDGTLLNSEKNISPKTKATLIDAQQKGIKLVLASGRPTTGMIQHAEELEMAKHHGLLVSYNGAKVIDCQTMAELYSRGLTVSEGKAVLEHLKQFDVKVMIDKGNYMYVNNVFADHLMYRGTEINIIEYEARGGNFLLCEQADLAESLDHELSKILTAADSDYLAENHKKMMAPFEQTLNAMFTADFYFEFTAKNVDKAQALATVLQPMGIEPAEMMAVGDGHNDRSMLEYAGFSIAMENAVQELKDIATHVTLSNDDDGIAHILNELL